MSRSTAGSDRTRAASSMPSTSSSLGNSSAACGPKRKAVSDFLLAERGIYIQPINYPAVPKGTERLRITPTPFHTDEQCNRLVESLCAAWDEFKLWSNRE